jgi:hypothetical protein
MNIVLLQGFGASDLCVICEHQIYKVLCEHIEFDPLFSTCFIHEH